jgi:hypothetical protein
MARALIKVMRTSLVGAKCAAMGQFAFVTPILVLDRSAHSPIGGLGHKSNPLCLLQLVDPRASAPGAPLTLLPPTRSSLQ